MSSIALQKQDGLYKNASHYTMQAESLLYITSWISLQGWSRIVGIDHTEVRVQHDLTTQQYSMLNAEHRTDDQCHIYYFLLCVPTHMNPDVTTSSLDSLSTCSCLTYLSKIQASCYSRTCKSSVKALIQGSAEKATNYNRPSLTAAHKK